MEDLNVAGMLRADGSTRNKQDVAWRQFITLLEYEADLPGTHVKQVEAKGTTKECASCGVDAAKPIWVREHSCPACRFETARDANASMNVLKRGFSELGLGWPEEAPVEPVTATDTPDFQRMSASHVIETGSLGVKPRGDSPVLLVSPSTLAYPFCFQSLHYLGSTVSSPGKPPEDRDHISSSLRCREPG